MKEVTLNLTRIFYAKLRVSLKGIVNLYNTKRRQTPSEDYIPFFLVYLAIFFVTLFNSYDYQNKLNLDGQKYYDKYKVGTICSDGWISRSSGRGTCSWHGGVSKHIYEKSFAGIHHKSFTGNYWLFAVLIVFALVFTLAFPKIRYLFFCQLKILLLVLKGLVLMPLFIGSLLLAWAILILTYISEFNS